MENGKKRFDGKLLVENPLLQSIYSETLRIYVTILYLRTTLHDGELDGKTIPAGSKIMCCNWSQQMNEEVWNPTGDSKIPPASEFWGKRFLEYPDGDETKTPRFKAEDIGGGRWFPFSIGEHLCPGRNAAKREIILVFAVLATYFEVELLEEGKKPKPDLNRFGYGTLPPSGASACRIRRKVEEH